MSTTSTQVWTASTRLGNNLISASPAGIFIGSVSGEMAEPVSEALRRDEVPSVQGLELVEWTTVNRVRGDIKSSSNSVSVSWKSTKGSKTETKSESFSFASPTDRDDFFVHLREVMPSSFAYSEDELTLVRAAIGPGLWTIGLSAFTWIAYLGARDLASGTAEAEIKGRRQAVKRLFLWLMETLGPTGILVLGSVLVLIALAVLVSRVKNPPHYRIVKPA
ncbi:hypothetical protein Pan216_42960 [Planctomycetes bacterium Pan216]|uniref:Uncharacterized protein n=1 Tax=Kolteria novifilia TaxID=2527975 RepID=A0A518B8W1_9BACT|nr:hypothetical protein Pan216_42960 [Planctomycetes bacterium Pan216]